MSAGMPGDRGLPALGLMMQLWAGIDALLYVTFALFMLRMPAAPGLMTVLLLVLGLTRAFVHLVAGLEIRSCGMKIASRVRALLVVSVVHAGVVFWRTQGKMGERLLVTFDLVAWPLLLVVVLHTPAWRQRLRELGEGELSLRDPNRSVEAVGAIMVSLGAVGTVLTGAVGWALLEGPPSTLTPSRTPELGTWVLLSVVALLLRSVFHVGVGVVAMRGASPGRFHHLVSLYGKVCWVTLFVAVVPVLLAIVEGVPFMGTLAITMVTMLSVWPLLLRGYAAQVGGEHGELDDLDDLGSPRSARAPDGGLVAVGWLLLAVAAGSLVSALAQLIYGPVSWAGVGMLQGPGWFVDPSLPVWTGIVGVGVTLWAGLELVSLTPRARVAALVFALLTMSLALWAHVDSLDAVGRGIGEALVRIQMVFIRADLLASLVIPMVVVVLALRARGHD